MRRRFLSRLGTTFGTTVMGHLNLVSGQTHGATPATVSGKVANGSVIANIDPKGDDCSTGTSIQMAGPSVGDLLIDARLRRRSGLLSFRCLLIERAERLKGASASAGVRLDLLGLSILADESERPAKPVFQDRVAALGRSCLAVKCRRLRPVPTLRDPGSMLKQQWRR